MTSRPDRRPDRRQVTRALAACALGLASVAANCTQCEEAQDLRRGNLDRATDAVLVTPTSGALEGHTLAFIANPDLEHLRVFDLFTESFVDAPNPYFPVSIPVGPDTRRLAVAVPAASPTGQAAPDESRVFALDGASDQVFIVDTVTLATTGELATGRAPGDIAALGSGDDIELWITLPGESAVEVLDLAGNSLARLQLPDVDGVPAAPNSIVVDPLGESIVVGDAAQPLVHVFSRANRATFVHNRSLDVGGSVGSLAAGVLDIGDGFAPIVLALLRDAPVATAVRLFRPVPEDRYAVVGSVELPNLGLAAYVPDNRESATVCCRELKGEVVEAGEATDAWAAVATVDGKLVYLSILANDGLVRLMDNDLAEVSEGEAIDGAWVPEPGDEDREPDVTVEDTGEFGDPPFVPFFDEDDQITLVWEQALPGLSRLRGTFDGGDSAFVATTSLEDRGAAVGDLAIVTMQDPEAGCPLEIEYLVDAVQGAEVRLLVSDEDEECLVGAGTLRLSIAPSEAFVATNRDGEFLGTVAPGGELPLSGAVLVVEPSPAGPPQHRGSSLLVPLDAHVSVVDLDLSDPASFAAEDGGGFGFAGLLPIAIVGREMVVPGVEGGTTITARRMVIATAASDTSGLNVIFTCDEAEHFPGLCLSFR